MVKDAPSLGKIAAMVRFALSCFGLLLFLWLAFGGPVPLKPKGYRFHPSFAEAGHSLAFFPEGTFTAAPGLRRFHLGAFVAAARAHQPVVPIVIRGTRRSMPSGHAVPRAGRIEVELLEPIMPTNDRNAAEILRGEARRRMAARIDEPDLEVHAPVAVPEARGA